MSANNETPIVTRRDVIEAIDWMGSGDVIDFDEANWSTVDVDGKVKVCGYAETSTGRHFVEAVFTLDSVTANYCPEDDQ